MKYLNLGFGTFDGVVARSVHKSMKSGICTGSLLLEYLYITNISYNNRNKRKSKGI